MTDSTAKGIDQALLFGRDGRVAYQATQSPRPPEPPAVRDRPTSVAAGRRIRLPRKTYRGQVLDALRAGPKTDEEICRTTDLRGSTVRPRRIELVQEGLVEDSGDTRPTTSGRDAIVWRMRDAPRGDRCRST